MNDDPPRHPRSIALNPPRTALPPRSDFLRLCFLAEHGGFYVDMDEYPGERSLTELIAMGKPLILANNTASKRDLRVYNAFIGAVPHHPALVSLAEQVIMPPPP